MGKNALNTEELKVPVTLKRLKKLTTQNDILKKDPLSHQFLLKNAAVKGQKKPSKKNRSPSDFPATLAQVKEMMDAVPSGSSEQEKEGTIIPAFRGIKWKGNLSNEELFFATRAQWIDQNHFSAMAGNWSKTDIKSHTIQEVLRNKSNLERFKNYGIETYLNKSKPTFEETVSKLNDAAKHIETLFKLAEPIKLPFKQWKTHFSGIRNSKALEGKDISLKDVLSYIYVNDYSGFQKIFKNLPKTIETLDDKAPEVKALKEFLKNLTEKKLTLEGIPYLSEGQIPRHALLYAFGVKEYSDSVEDSKVSPLYTQKNVPQKGHVYLGKIMVTKNPHTLFKKTGTTTLIPDFDKKWGGSVIAKTIIGEKEIQHVGANLSGSIAKSVNIKLPKFNHEKMPERYSAKYGFSEELYKQFKTTFVWLDTQKEYGKLSWYYLESLLIAHLIQFHEAQLFRNCETMAQSEKKTINWHSRHGESMASPFLKN